MSLVAEAPTVHEHQLSLKLDNDVRTVDGHRHRHGDASWGQAYPASECGYARAAPG
jgi:hypothetical protein